MNYRDNKPLIDALAAEYVLGTLVGRARQRFERWLANDGDGVLRAEVDAWERRLNNMADQAPPIPVPNSDQLFSQVQQRLFTDTEPAAQPSWFERIAFWRTLSLGSGALAFALAAALVLNVTQNDGADSAAPELVMLIQNNQQQSVWTGSASNNFSQLLVRNDKPMDMPQGRGCLLWIQPAGSDTFYPVGLLPDDGSVVKLNIDEQLRAQLPNSRLIVTVEDKDHFPQSPSNAPEFTSQLISLDSI